MQTPRKSASFQNHARFAFYTIRRLSLKGHEDLLQPLQEKAQSLITLGRSWEDSTMATYQAYAERDAEDEGLDGLTSQAALTIAARSVGAVKEPPYTQIFSEGVAYYTRAPLGEEEARYQLLASLLEEYLGAEDPVVIATVPELRAGVSRFSKAAEALSLLQQEESRARLRLETCVDELTTLLTETHALLVTRVGKVKAESYFRKADS